MLLTSRQLLQAKALDIENDLRGTLRNFGLKVGMVGTTGLAGWGGGTRTCECRVSIPFLSL
jgi:hypothetical protein